MATYLKTPEGSDDSESSSEDESLQQYVNELVGNAFIGEDEVFAESDRSSSGDSSSDTESGEILFCKDNDNEKNTASKNTGDGKSKSVKLMKKTEYEANISQKQKARRTTCARKTTILSTDELDFYYQNCLQVQFLDITNEFSDSEIFLVDGDSLLVDALNDRNFSSKYGGQLLHLVYICERKLQLFVRRGGEFHLVFFKAWEKVWANNPLALLARSVLMSHFKHNTPHKVFTFTGIWNNQFNSHLEHFKPTFLLTRLSCGELYGNYNLMLENLLFAVLQCGLHSVFLDGLSPGISELKGHHVSLNYNKFMRLKRSDMKKKFQDVAREHASVLPHGEIGENSTRKILTLYKSLHLKTVRQIVTVISTVLYLQDLEEKVSSIDEDLIRSLIACCAVVESLPLSLRGVSVSEIDVDVTVENFISKIQALMSQVLQCLEEQKVIAKEKMMFVADLWHGIFFVSFISMLDCETCLEDENKTVYENMLGEVKRILGRDIQSFPIICDSNLTRGEAWVSPEFRSQEEADEFKIDCLGSNSSRLYQEFGKDILPSARLSYPQLMGENMQEYLISDEEFLNNFHWLSGVFMSDELARIKDTSFNVKNCVDRRVRQRLEKQHLNFCRYMYQYGMNLAGKPSQQNPIVCTDESSRSKGKQKKQSKKALEIIKNNEQRKLKEREEKEREQLKNLKDSLKVLMRNKQESDVLMKIDHVAGTLETENCLKEALLIKADFCYSLWRKECKRKRSSSRDTGPAEQLFLCLKTLLKQHRKLLSVKEEKQVSNYLNEIGFGDIQQLWSLSEKSSPREDNVSLNISSSRFQLMHLGHTLDRDVRSDPDSRVSEFIPDTWQRELFDVVDRQQSALIVAPTSSGKTYASYYCMEKVLRSSNDGVVVYVSPTKALVNQVAATVCARFSRKQMPSGKTVYGVFTRDFKQNALDCQILMTVPQCLEILLMSPQQREWVKRLRYVIFDEVHCLGGRSDGAVWEHVITLIKCPFLALSATIRNPEGLHSWLQEAEHFKEKRDKLDGCGRLHSSYKVQLVVHNERHADLTKYMFDTKSYYDAEQKLVEQRDLKHVHPYALLNRAVIEHHEGIPEHISLSPKEALQLYDAINSVWPEDVEVKSLSPESYFSGFITRSDVRKYEKQMKEMMIEWSRNYKDKFEAVVAHLGKDLDIGISSYQENCGVPFISRKIVPLVQQLKYENKLPALIFMYDRYFCVCLNDIMRRFYERLEEHVKARNEKMTQFFEEKKERRIKMQQKLEDQRSKPVKRTIVNPDIDGENPRRHETDMPTVKLVDKSILQCCSVKGVGAVDEDDLKFVEERLTFTRWKEINGIWKMQLVQDTKTKNLISGMKRGLSYHHGGLSSRKRVAVEMLFRMKFLNVVFATGTLALGIHMPCKTVVVAGNSPFLNSLEYHQMSGRAGRRGFDLAGEVIFFGVPQRKMQRLMTAHLPKLVGNFPLTVSYVLKTMLLVSEVYYTGEGSEKAVADAMSSALGMLNNFLIYKTYPQLRPQIQHFFCYSVQLLMLQKLLSDCGNPQCFTRIASHLHYHEPGNLAFVFLLKCGAFHDLCRKKNDGKFSFKTFSTMTIVLSHLFTHTALHPSVGKRQHERSKVILPPLPEPFTTQVEKFNEQVETVFSHCLRSVAKHCDRTMGEDRCLPLSGLEFRSSRNFQASGATLETKLAETSTPNKICSSFAALSGHGDDSLCGYAALKSNVRHQVFTDVKMVPVMDVNSSLNAYAWDFFQHGSAYAIREENYIREGYDFDLLNDFCLVLRCINTSLEEVAPETDPVRDAFNQLERIYKAKFNKAFDIEEYKLL